MSVWTCFSIKNLYDFELRKLSWAFSLDWSFTCHPGIRLRLSWLATGGWFPCQVICTYINILHSWFKAANTQEGTSFATDNPLISNLQQWHSSLTNKNHLHPIWALWDNRLLLQVFYASKIVNWNNAMDIEYLKTRSHHFETILLRLKTFFKDITWVSKHLFSVNIQILRVSCFRQFPVQGSRNSGRS